MSIGKGKISGSQLLFLVAGFIQGAVLPISYVTEMTERQTWMAILTSMGLSAPFILSYVILMKRFPGMNIVQINEKVYGRFLGSIFSIYYIFFFLMTLSFNIRDVGNFYITFLMPDTPFIFFLVVFTATCAYAVSKGIEVLARVGYLFAGTLVLVAVGTFLLQIGEIDFSNFVPFFEVPLARFAQGTHFLSAVSWGEMLVFVVIMASLNKTEHAVKNTLLGAAIGGLTLIFVAIRNTGVLGETQTIWSSSSFQSVRLIDIGNVLTRMDLLIGIAQTIAIFLKCSLFYYVLAVALAQLFRLKSYFPLILPIAGIEVIIAATVFQSQIEQVIISLNSGIIYSAPLMYIVPPLTLLIAKIRSLPKAERRMRE